MNLKSNKRLLAVILGVALVATMGASLAYAQTAPAPNSQPQQPPQIQGSINLQQLIMSNVKTSFSDAANTAASKVSGTVISGSLTMKQGYVVYDFKVLGSDNKIYSVVVDAGNGSVLYTSQGQTMHFGSIFGMNQHGPAMHKFHMGGFGGNWQKPQAPSTTNPSSGVTSPDTNQE